jgi:TonB family protein
MVSDARIAQPPIVAELTRAAMKAAKQWKFKPAKLDEKPAVCKIVIPFEFTLCDRPR